MRERATRHGGTFTISDLGTIGDTESAAERASAGNGGRTATGSAAAPPAATLATPATPPTSGTRLTWAFRCPTVEGHGNQHPAGLRPPPTSARPRGPRPAGGEPALAARMSGTRGSRPGPMAVPRGDGSGLCWIGGRSRTHVPARSRTHVPAPELSTAYPGRVPELAQANVARMRAPLDHPTMSGF